MLIILDMICPKIVAISFLTNKTGMTNVVEVWGGVYIEEIQLQE